MRSPAVVITAFLATAYAAPAFPDLNVGAALPGTIETMSQYFNMLATKVQANRYMSMVPVCDLSKAQLPAAPQPLPPPSKGLTLKHVAIGRGTQNYTCDTTNTTAVPVPAGAVATLFNISCVAAMWSDVSDFLPKVSMQFNLTADENPKLGGAANLAISGVHYFPVVTVPFFNLDTKAQQLGHAYCAKDSATPAPPNAPRGQQGEPAVPWLKLVTKEGTTGDLQEVYRVNTVGGSAPASCKGLPAKFEVQYSAQYWFFQGPPPAKSTP